MIVNAPEPLGALEAAFAAYEKALMSNDVVALDGFFWDSGFALRYGVGENLYGFEAISAFRMARPGGSPNRVLSNTVITTFGDDFGTANTEFKRENSAKSGRQSQTWVRFAQGWRIVAAHVSFMTDTH